MTARFMGNFVRSYDEHADHSRRLLFARDRQISKLTGALQCVASTFDFVRDVIREEGRRDPAWTLAQVREATEGLHERIERTIGLARRDRADQFGELDHRGHLTPDTERHDMWTIAAWLPKGREAEVAEFLAEHGIEVYRMWQATADPEYWPAAAGKDGKQ
jgi:hypothetical protein